MTSWNEEGTAPSGSGPFPTIYQSTINYENLYGRSPLAQVVPSPQRRRSFQRKDYSESGWESVCTTGCIVPSAL